MFGFCLVKRNLEEELWELQKVKGVLDQEEEACE